MLKQLALVSLVVLPSVSFAEGIVGFAPKVDCDFTLLTTDLSRLAQGSFGSKSIEKSYELKNPKVIRGKEFYEVNDLVSFGSYEAKVTVQFQAEGSNIFSARNKLVTDMHSEEPMDGILWSYVMLLKGAPGHKVVLSKTIETSDSYTFAGDMTMRAMSIHAAAHVNNPEIDSILLNDGRNLDVVEAAKAGIIPDGLAHHISYHCKVNRTEVIMP